MSSNVLALEPPLSLYHEGRPDRAEVEAAARIIVRWSGDNPDRGGLIETPARVTRGFEEASVGYIQDAVAAQIANTVNEVHEPLGVGVVIKASHHCMVARVHKPDTDLVTSRMLGCLRDNA
jgi:GTP cyclohydrolase I